MRIQTTKQLADAIRARRHQLGITQSDLAMTCATGLRFIVDLEKGKPTCQIGKALDVLHSLGLTVDVAPVGRVAIGANT